MHGCSASDVFAMARLSLHNKSRRVAQQVDRMQQKSKRGVYARITPHRFVQGLRLTDHDRIELFESEEASCKVCGIPEYLPPMSCCQNRELPIEIVCKTCGTPQYLVDLKTCCGCRFAKYCSKPCQVKIVHGPTRIQS